MKNKPLYFPFIAGIAIICLKIDVFSNGFSGINLRTPEEALSTHLSAIREGTGPVNIEKYEIVDKKIYTAQMAKFYPAIPKAEEGDVKFDVKEYIDGQEHMMTYLLRQINQEWRIIAFSGSFKQGEEPDFDSLDMSSNGCSRQEIVHSSHLFITQFYKDSANGMSVSRMKKYFLELDEETEYALLDNGYQVSGITLSKENLEFLMTGYRDVLKFDFQKTELFSRKIPVIGFTVSEWSMSDDPFSNEHTGESFFMLKEVGKCRWKIIQIGQPGMVP